MSVNKSRNIMNSILVDFKLFKDWQFPQILSEETGEVWTALECHSNKFYGGKINITPFLLVFLLSLAEDYS